MWKYFFVHLDWSVLVEVRLLDLHGGVIFGELLNQLCSEIPQGCTFDLEVYVGEGNSFIL